MRRMNRRTFLASTASAPAILTGAASGRPNLILILTDQQSNCALSAHGNRHLQTPAMDSLVARGASFTESYCTYPVCSPARSSLMTSRMPHETGVRVNGRAIAAGMPTMGEHFREHGYATVYGGKWHLPKSFQEPPGFDYLIGGNSLGARMDEPLATAAARFLTEKPKQPFLLVASFMNPHDICSWIRAHPGTREYEDPSRFPPPRLNMAIDPDEPEYLQYHRTGNYNLMSNSLKISSEWKLDDWRFYLHDYYRMVEDVDRQIGRVLSALKLSGLEANTLVVLTADHGEGQGSHRWTQKAALWEETAKVPLIVAGAGVKARGLVDSRSLVSGLDVLPTLCDYAGIPAPPGLRGASLRPAIEQRAWNRRFVVSELSEYGGNERQGRMLRTRRYKYVAFNGGARPEQLFDLQLDPGETVNLARRPEAAQILREHRGLLGQWIAETGDDFRIAGG